MRRVAVHTLGCKVNQYDSQALLQLLARAGYRTVSFQEEADVYLINTCTVTAVADKKSRQMISRVHRRHPGALIVVAGCMAQREPEAVLELPGVDLVLGNARRLELPALIQRAYEEKVNAVSGIGKEKSYEPLFAQAQEGHARATVKIQEGCAEFCSYCIIPHVRGPLRSRVDKDVLLEAERLSEQGYREIVLTGIHLASYGKDRGEGIDALYRLIESLQRIRGIERIRLGSLEPTLFLGAFIQKAADLKKLCPHFHISMQSGSADVLRAMNRKYAPAEFLEALALVRRAIPDAAISTDIIAGFPGETEQNHIETLEVIRGAGFSRVHVFPYSRREGTPAALLPGQLSNAVKEQRASEIAQLGRRLAQDFARRFIGRVQPVLFEAADEDGRWRGLTPHYLTAFARGDIRPGEIRPVWIEGLTDGGLCARII